MVMWRSNPIASVPVCRGACRRCALHTRNEPANPGECWVCPQCRAYQFLVPDEQAPTGWHEAVNARDVMRAAFRAFVHEPTGVALVLLWFDRCDRWAGDGVFRWCVVHPQGTSRMVTVDGREWATDQTWWNVLSVVGERMARSLAKAHEGAGGA